MFFYGKEGLLGRMSQVADSLLALQINQVMRTEASRSKRTGVVHVCASYIPFGSPISFDSLSNDHLSLSGRGGVGYQGVGVGIGHERFNCTNIMFLYIQKLFKDVNSFMCSAAVPIMIAVQKDAV
jgi:hypothetical protein